MTRVSGTLLALTVAWSTPVHAQSVFNSAGMGLPVAALDGRVRALGSVGIGLQGGALLPSDPAAAARVVLPTGVIVVQPSWVKLTQEGVGDAEYFRGTRFPLMALAYPAFSGTVSVQLSSVFDQRYRGQRPVTVVLGGETLPARDFYAQEGAVTSISAGYARMLDERFGAGISVGRYTGSVARRLGRDFEETGISQVEPYQSVGTWRYSGESVTGGVMADFIGAVRVAASATWSTKLTADPTGETEGGARDFDVPLQLRLGASSILTPGLSLSASVSRADWSVTEVESSSRSGSVTAFGVGIELSQSRLLGRRAPLRLGFTRAGLPFSLERGGGGSERAFTGGLALVLNETNGVLLATADLAVEKGRRTAADFTEDFWRGTISLQLSSF